VLRRAEVSAWFALAPGVSAAFSETLEVSLDCCICHRCHRTVVFQAGGFDGKCTPTGHSFPGKLIGKEPGPTSVVYRLEYWYEPFADAKYPDRRTPTGWPTWGRVELEVVCPSCGQAQRCSTQTNIARPLVCRCRCGYELYIESEKMPVLSQEE
jgi:hypothetical protein